MTTTMKIKKCHQKKVKFEDYKHYLEATQLENKIPHSEKKNLNADNGGENHKEFIKNTKNTKNIQK